MTVIPELTPPARVAFQFASLPGDRLVHGMSGRLPTEPSQGDIAFARDSDYTAVADNRSAFLQAMGLAEASLTLGRQVHGNNVTVVTEADAGRGQSPDFDAIPDSDGLATDAPGLALGSIVADCAAVLLYDPDNHAVSLSHAGWRGTVGMIAARAVTTMTDVFGSRPQRLLAGISPAIGPCCYEVGDEVIDSWKMSGVAHAEQAIVPGEPRRHFDLWEANRLTLIEAGVLPDAIEIAGMCTRCDSERYFSHRAAMAGERPRGRMIMVVVLKDGAV